MESWRQISYNCKRLCYLDQYDDSSDGGRKVVESWLNYNRVV